MSKFTEEDFYEGSEKLLEVWFPVYIRKDADLRKIDRQSFEDILSKVSCEILSVIEDNTQVAYLLSESSMFVTRDKIIMKTCGVTTLFNAIDDLLSCANEVGFEDEQSLVFYSRRKFSKPGLQKSPHQKFSDESTVLLKHYPDGVYYAFGPLNSDCWYLFLSKCDIEVKKPDQTLECFSEREVHWMEYSTRIKEMIMTELDPEAMLPFFKQDPSQTGATATKTSGIDRVFDGVVPKIDDYLFEPCGYSMNGLLDNERYYTIHITPQIEFSYASFETNYLVNDYSDLITRVLALFRPKTVLITLFANEGSPAKKGVNMLSEGKQIRNYQRKDFARSQFGNYEFVFSRLGWRPE